MLEENPQSTGALKRCIHVMLPTGIYVRISELARKEHRPISNKAAQLIIDALGE